MENKDIFKTSRKDQVFEKLIKELQPITRKSLERNFGSGDKKHFNVAENELSEHTLRFDYSGFECIVQLKEK